MATRSDTSRQQAVTALLCAGGDGGREVTDALVPLVYDELRQMAHRQLARERDSLTLNTTGLVHEAYLKLVRSASVSAKGKDYFFAAAARAMRQVLVSTARRRLSLKRGGDLQLVTMGEDQATASALASDLVELDWALERLAIEYPRAARVVECRFFGGLSVVETATALDLSSRSVKRDWALAKAWLYRELELG